jgi:hypothetical protein
MPIQLGKITTSPQHRLHERLNKLLVLHEAIGTAVLLRIGRSTNFNRGDTATLACSQIPIAIRVPIVGPLQIAMANLKPDGIEIDVIPRPAEGQAFTPFAGGISAPQPVTGLQYILPTMTAPILVELYESVSDWLYSSIGHQDTWPSVLQFSRVIRHAASHGGSINMTGRSPKPVSWYGLTYSQSDNGRAVFGTDLGLGDLIALMLEMDEELSRLGCPV